MLRLSAIFHMEEEVGAVLERGHYMLRLLQAQKEATQADPQVCSNVIPYDGKNCIASTKYCFGPT